MANEPSPPTGAAGFPNGTPGPGAVLGGKFRVIRQLGEGGMGVVLEAEHTVSGKRVAIKWMRPELASRPEAVERFLREARASARVRHPNVVDVYDVVHEGNAAFLVMELLDGEPLTALLERGGMPAHELIALLLEAMRGVAAAHREGVIHRDIKPDNIFLARETDRSLRTPKVLDFGISKLSGGEGLALTQTGATLGTPLYMSFEQLCGVRDIDARTDVYAFGVILYEALTGRPPYEAETFPELIVKIANTQPKPPKSLRSDIPRSLDRLIQSAMAKERDQRFPSLEVMIRALEPFVTAELFRIQMTADDAALPRVISPSQQPPVEPALLLSERTETGPADTPMNTSVPVPAIPRRRDHAPWLIGAAVIAALLLAVMFFGPSGSPAAVVQPKPPTQADPPPTAAPSTAAATGQAEPPLEHGLAAPESPPLPAAGANRATQGMEPNPVRRMEAAQPRVGASARPNAELRPANQARDRGQKRSDLVGGAGKATLPQSAFAKPPLAAAPTVSLPTPAAPAAKPKPAKESERPPNLRAGRPRSQDF
jgi:serine/threonine protein kinase